MKSLKDHGKPFPMKKKEKSQEDKEDKIEIESWNHTRAQ
jgi:hypothetical protein